jgi:dTDP-4-dehydrorhamnose 3,5-epimerase
VVRGRQILLGKGARRLKFQPIELPGAFVITPEPHRDERGLFARIWCSREFEEHGLDPRLVQCSLSFNPVKGTLRGLHYQVEPHAEAKCIRCTRGSIYDVIVDLRTTSPTFKQWRSFELTADNRLALYVPEGMAHGFQTLAPDTEVMYHMSEFHHPDSARGVRWDDPAFGIAWPPDERTMSDRDRQYPDFDQ